MKNNHKIIIIGIIAALLGLAVGYLLFGHQKAPAAAHNHEAMTEASDGEAAVWTCSMHPQIRQNEPGICPICEMDLIPLEANTSNDPLVLQMTEAAVKLSNIQTTTIGQAATSTGNTIRLSGKVQADERRAATQVAHIPGRIEQLFVSFSGEQVVKGQKLATIYSPELITAQRELLEALKLADLNPGLAEAARNKLRFWKIGKATIDAIEAKGDIQETFHLYADQTGIVTERRVSVGDYVKQGEPLFDLMNLHKVWVLFDAYEASLPGISVGDKIEFTTPALPDQTFTTRITFIGPVINPNTRVASLRVEVSNAKKLLKPEMFVTGILEEKGGRQQQLTVPKSAVMWTGKRSVVYVKLPDMTIPSFQFKEIEIGESIGDRYLVLEGLTAGDVVVTNGSFTIDAAAQLNNQASMMNRNIALKKEENAAPPDFRAVTPAQFQEQLQQVVDQYLALKNALVATDATAATAAAEEIVGQLEKTDMTLLKDEAHIFWMERLNVLEAHVPKLASSPEIAAQREQFGFISDALIAAVEAFGLPDQTLYVQHCPMAFDNQGADWLSNEEGIRNPYFGDKMMKCGTVKRSVE